MSPGSHTHGASPFPPLHSLPGVIPQAVRLISRPQPVGYQACLDGLGRRLLSSLSREHPGLSFHAGRALMIIFCIMCGAAGGPRWEPESPRRSISTTQKIRSIGREARVNQLISERLEHWKAHMRERGEHTCIQHP